MSRLLCFKTLKFLVLLKSSRYFSVFILLSGLTLLTPKIGFSQTPLTVILGYTDAAARQNITFTLANLRSSIKHKLGLGRSESLSNTILCI